MNPYRRGARCVALAGVVAVGLFAQAYAGDTRDEQPPTAQTAPALVAPDAASPPFWVAGVVIAPTRRSAILVPLDDARRELGIVTLHEGESYNGHRLVRVEPAHVLLEQNGIASSLGVGRPYSGSRGASEAGRRDGTGPIFIPGPDKPTPDLEYTGPQVRRGVGSGTPGVPTEPSPDPEAVGNFIERLFSHPQIREQIEEIRPIMREKMERARQDSQGTPATPQGVSR